ncbi:MAG: hypothetical protein LQ338_005680 [Usnochroma carphineum]|nr:MAG: hypothetical protein LQ338_005680 [Usnochroma carphineum]
MTSQASPPSVRAPLPTQGFKELLDTLNEIQADRIPKIYEQIRLEQGFAPDYLVFNIGSTTLPELLDHLHTSQPTVSDFVDEKIRPVHECFAAQLLTRITCQLAKNIDQLRNDGEDPKIIKELEAITPMGASRVDLIVPLKFEQIWPDASWQPQLGSEHPSILLKVAFSDRESHLGEMASRIFQGTDGGVRWIVGVEVQYPVQQLESPKAWFWLWKAGISAHGGYEKETVINQQQFMPDNAGGATLPLKLHYFLSPQSTLPHRIQNREISIPLGGLSKVITAKLKAELELETERDAVIKSRSLTAPKQSGMPQGHEQMQNTDDQGAEIHPAGNFVWK